MSSTVAMDANLTLHDVGFILPKPMRATPIDLCTVLVDVSYFEI